MKKYAMEGMVAILAVALVLGLAASAFPHELPETDWRSQFLDKEKSFWSFGGYWGRGWYDEIILKGGTLFEGESYNEFVDQLEEQFKVIEREVTDLGGGL